MPAPINHNKPKSENRPVKRHALCGRVHQMGACQLKAQIRTTNRKGQPMPQQVRLRWHEYTVAERAMHDMIAEAY
jgi:hypothetical protein